jgi:hypothetical protein
MEACMKRGLSVLVAAAAVAGLVLCGCATKQAMHPITTFVVPDFSARTIKIVGLMPIAERAGVEEAGLKLLPVLEGQLATKTAYVFLSQEQVLGAVQKSGVSDRYKTLLSGWRDNGALSAEAAVEVARKAGVDALMFIEVSTWSREYVAANTEGESVSKVGLRAVLVGAKTGEKLWEAFDEQTMQSAHYSPESGIGTYVDEAGMVRSSGGAGVPEPPPIEEVALRAATALFRVLP